jgi:XTP/dITP diphosphohydrolase
VAEVADVVEPTPARKGERFLELVEVMDRLRSPGGCPWDAEQTHASLVKYLLEEAYETAEAIEDADGPALREELGDVLLQVVFHARIAQEGDAEASEAWDIDDVAAGIVDKLVRRHPHVFAGAQADTAGDVEANWEALKAAEKGRTSAADGVPMAQPALALASALLGRSAKAGQAVEVETAIEARSSTKTRLAGCSSPWSRWHAPRTSMPRRRCGLRHEGCVPTSSNSARRRRAREAMSLS